MEQWPPTHAAHAKWHREVPRDDFMEFELLDFLNHGEEGEGAIGLRRASTKSDQRDMYRMGKKQQFKRNYRPLSALSFAVVLTAIWEYLMVACTQGLVNGGTAGLFWTYVWTSVGFTFVEMSLAEMSSMAPISGGQYHWVSEFAPPQSQQILSYVVGWMSTLSWQAGNAADCFLTGTISQALLVVNNPDHNPQPWHGTLFVYSMVVMVYIMNVWGHNLWPRVQNPLMILHVLGFFGIVSTLWCLAPHRSPKAVFTEFSEHGGWSGLGLSLMVGQVSAIYSALGSDATAHMAEEVRDASRYVPISLFWSYVANSLMAIGFLIGFLTAIPDVEAAINDNSGYPFLYVLKNAVNLAGVNAITIIVLLLLTAANINFGASTARQTFAFARDNGLPFSGWIAKVDTEKEIPRNAILFSSVFSALLALIDIGSTTAFNAIVSLQVVSLMFTYTVSISCVLYRRIKHPELLPKARWSLGKWGVPVNALGLGYVSFAFFWSFWPTFTPITLHNFNWSVVIFVAVLIVCLAMYYTSGRHVYQGPVKKLRRVSVPLAGASITI